ncbi:hypothetical protein [Allokutzneria multivorans]
MASTGTRGVQWRYHATAIAAYVSQISWPAASWQVQASSVDAGSPP